MTSNLRRFLRYGLAFGAYGVLVTAANWPLPVQLTSHLTGQVSGDTGVYVWNQWLFRHELTAHHRFPLFTREILSLTPPVDLSLHNYTLFADLLAYPLLPRLGVVATFNLIYLFTVALSAWAMFVLARAVIGRSAEAWLAGALFGLSPVLTARGTAHFSLVAAAPLPIFVFFLRRAERHLGVGNAVAMGLTVAWASVCDPYYGVFCVVLGVAYLGFRRVRLRTSGAVRGSAVLTVDLLAISVIGLAVGIAVSGGGMVVMGATTIGLRSLYTPMLLLTILAMARVSLVWRPRIIQWRPSKPSAALKFGVVAAAAWALALSPVLYSLVHRFQDGGALHGQIFWRSSPAGVDLASLLMPNPNSGLLGRPFAAWLDGQPGRFAENVASLTIVGLVVVALAVRQGQFTPPRPWIGLTAGFAALSLGPFIRIAGWNSYIPGPWALLRYIPLVSATRTPARYAVVAMMAFSVLFALALAHITKRRPNRRRVILVVVTCGLGIELLPLPRRLFDATIPAVYRVIAADPRDVRVLELPFGIRDGEQSLGDFSAASQFFQTLHEKPLIGGYLSRISQHEIRRQLALPTVDALRRLSEGRPVPDSIREILPARARSFPSRVRLGYVIVDSARCSPTLRSFAIDHFALVKVAEADGRELYRTSLQ